MATNEMRAIIQDTLGGPEVLHQTVLDRPTPGPGQVLVRVHATGLNPTDWVHRRFAGFLGEVPRPGRVLGWDVSGTVETVGLGVTLHQPGDEVFGMLPYPYGHGAAAEYVLAPARALAPKPANLTHVEAGALPLVALTAWQALVDTANVRAGQRVLVHAAAGGVGHVAVQIAAALGAEVVGTASAHNHDLVRQLGAARVVDYTRTDFATEVSDVDVVLDTIGGDYPARSLATMRSGGAIVSLTFRDPGLVPEAAAARGVRQELMLVEADQAGMRAVADLVTAGKLRPVVAATFDLADAVKGHALGETGHVAGKIVLTP